MLYEIRYSQFIKGDVINIYAISAGSGNYVIIIMKNPSTLEIRQAPAKRVIIQKNNPC